MPSFYTIVRYVPDPIADERMNVGVVVCGDGRIKANFLQRWNRARGFGRENVAFLREFAQQFSEDQLPLLPDMPKCDEAALKKIVGHWKNSIQFSEPRASLKSPEELLEEVSERFLHGDLEDGVREARWKSKAVSEGIRKVRAVLSEQLDEKSLRKFVKREVPLRGSSGEHRFDIVVQNGHPLFAINALSFEGTDSARLHTAVDATAFAFLDVRNKNKELPLAAFAPRHKRAMDTYRYAEKAFDHYKIPFLTDGEMESWTRKTAKKVDLLSAVGCQRS